MSCLREKNANINKAKNIIFNSKMRRPSICGAAETLLIDESLYKYCNELLEPLIKAGCEIRGEENIIKLNSSFKKATETDWETEYLEKIISVKIVKGIDEAIDHINKYSSSHMSQLLQRIRNV